MANDGPPSMVTMETVIEEEEEEHILSIAALISRGSPSFRAGIFDAPSIQPSGDLVGAVAGQALFRQPLPKRERRVVFQVLVHECRGGSRRGPPGPARFPASVAFRHELDLLR